MKPLASGPAFRRLTAIAAVMLIAAGSAGSEPILGTWKTEPDRKSLVSLIDIAACGAALCGTILKAFDASGAEVTTPNIGKRLFWDLVPEGNGVYDRGTVWVPLLDIVATAHAELSGDRLVVTGCKGPVCDSQTWSRVR